MCGPILSDCKPKAAQMTERKEDDKLVLYRGHRLFVMGVYASEIWHLCDGKHTIDNMIELVVSKYNVPREKAKQELIAFINQLAEKKLIFWEEK